MATGLVNDTKTDLVRNLQNLEPALKALADVGPKLDTALAYLPTFPYTQQVIDRGIRGDYLNQFIIFDLTVPRLKKTLMLGTRWGDENAKLVPAPGDPSDTTYTCDPLNAPFSPATPPMQVEDIDTGMPPGPGQPASLAGATQPAPSMGSDPQPGPVSGPLPGPAPEPAPQDGGN